MRMGADVIVKATAREGVYCESGTGCPLLAVWELRRAGELVTRRCDGHRDDLFDNYPEAEPPEGMLENLRPTSSGVRVLPSQSRFPLDGLDPHV
jgi:hypothetical protein